MLSLRGRGWRGLPCSREEGYMCAWRVMSTHEYVSFAWGTQIMVCMHAWRCMHIQCARVYMYAYDAYEHKHGAQGLCVGLIFRSNRQMCSPDLLCLCTCECALPWMCCQAGVHAAVGGAGACGWVLIVGTHVEVCGHVQGAVITTGLC